MGQLLQLKKSPPNKAAIMDEFGDVDKLRREFAPVEKRYQQLREEIVSWYSDKPAEEEYFEKGERFQLWISPRETQRQVDVRAAYKRLGIAKFLKACAVTLKALEGLLPKPEVESLVVAARTGSRTISPTPITPPPSKAGQPVDLKEAA